jgi:hypothetical protein
MYLGLSPIWRKVFAVKFLDRSRKVFALFFDGQIRQKLFKWHPTGLEPGYPRLGRHYTIHSAILAHIVTENITRHS